MTLRNDEGGEMFGTRPDEAPVARIVAALTAPATPAELRDERSAIDSALRLAWMDAELAALSPPRSPMHGLALRRKLLVPVVAGAIVVGTAGLAMAGALPAPAQDAFAKVLDRVGITVPASADQHPSPTTTDHPASTGTDISQIATDPSTPSLQKGIAVSGTASGGMSQAGQHGSASDHPTGAPSSVPP
ncbi:MAG: hypothetical protein ACXVQJ_07775, partial [Actinomycetota bacterium]